MKYLICCIFILNIFSLTFASVAPVPFLTWSNENYIEGKNIENLNSLTSKNVLDMLNSLQEMKNQPETIVIYIHPEVRMDHFSQNFQGTPLQKCFDEALTSEMSPYLYLDENFSSALTPFIENNKELNIVMLGENEILNNVNQIDMESVQNNLKDSQNLIIVNLPENQKAQDVTVEQMNSILAETNFVAIFTSEKAQEISIKKVFETKNEQHKNSFNRRINTANGPVFQTYMPPYMFQYVSISIFLVFIVATAAYCTGTIQTPRGFETPKKKEAAY
eukprot:TRINITY_DN405_c0_g1_i1.p1 TRINITY_DN405_c0_g1~~TRINITY_DN405_c0_g1_i1.p1  ORF type:complete len:276 (-),score=56.77 TRINITY_DN405_c0_g1_i1:29-856(-)